MTACTVIHHAVGDASAGSDVNVNSSEPLAKGYSIADSVGPQLRACGRYESLPVLP